MAVTSKLYGQFLKEAITSPMNIAGDALKVMLCTSSYVPDQDTHIATTDVTNEVTGAGYTAGGVSLANVVITYDAATNVIKMDADDVVWEASTITARYAVIYDSTVSKLIGYVDFGEDKVSSNGSFTITWDTAGVLSITVA